MASDGAETLTLTIVPRNIQSYIEIGQRLLAKVISADRQTDTYRHTHK